MFEKKNKVKVYIIRFILGGMALLMASGIFLQLYSSYHGAKESEEYMETYRESMKDSAEEDGGYLDVENQ